MIALYNPAAERGNFGDLLLLEIFKRWIEEYYDSNVVFPFISKQKLKHFQTSFPTAQTGFQGYLDWKALIYAGGGQFGETNSTEKTYFFRKFNQRIITDSVPAQFCMRHNIPYGVVGVEAGPIANIIVRKKIRRLVNNSSLFTVRNQESYDFLKQELKTEKCISITLDPVLALSEKDIPDHAIKKVDKLLKYDSNTIYIGIHHPVQLLKNSSTTNMIIDSIIYHLKNHSDTVPVVFSDFGFTGSHKASDELAARISYSAGIKCLSIPFEGIWDLVALISKMSSLLTTKLHVGMLAYIFGIYCEAFAIHIKTPRFYKIIGRQDQCHMFKCLNKELIHEKVSKVFKYADKSVNLSDGHYLLLKEQALNNRDIIGSLI